MINKNNFIRWYGSLNFGPAINNTPDTPILNRSYTKDEGNYFGPLFFPGHLYSFYANFTEPITVLFSTISNLRFGIRKFGYLSPLTLIGNITVDYIDATAPYFNIIFNISSFPNLSPGWYQFVVYNVTDTNIITTIKLQSNPVEVASLEDVGNIPKIYFKHSYNKNNIQYELNPTFYNIFHLPLIQTGFSIEQDKTQYRNVTNRRLRNIKTYTDVTVKIESYNFDEEGHKAMALVYEHDTIFINKTFIIPKDAYQVENKPNSVLCKASINAYADYSVVNPNL